jgi:hypothetical protein
MDQIEIQWFPKRDPKEESIAQIYSNGLEFAVATDRSQCSHFVYCKDFLHDAVWAMLYDTPVDIHGFKYDPKIHPISLDITRMLIANSSDEFFCDRIPNCLNFLHQAERHLHLRRTKASYCVNSPENYLPGGVFLLEGSQRWMSSPPLLSLYTLFVRCGFVHNIGDSFIDTLNKIQSGEIKAYQANDTEFVRDARPAIDVILHLGYRKIFYKDIKRNYPQNIDTHTLHHHFGIRGYSWAKETRPIVPYWHRTALLETLKEKGINLKNLWEQPQSQIQSAIPETVTFVGKTYDVRFAHSNFGSKNVEKLWE